MSRVNEQDYFLKNFISKCLAIIASKENKDNFVILISIIIDKINAFNENFSNESTIIDDYLRLLLNILKETDNTVYYITKDLMQIIMRIFIMSNVIFFINLI